jgi:hypothetical protein
VTHIRQRSQAIGSVANTRDNVGRGPWISLLDEFVDALDIA